MTFETAAHRSTPPRSKPAGTVLAIVLLVLLAVGTLGVSFTGASLGFTRGACLDGGCSMIRIELGWIAAAALPWFALASAVAATIVLTARGREAWWVPLVGAPAVIVAFAFGWMLWSTGLPL